jgi:hypothetical protein
MEYEPMQRIKKLICHALCPRAIYAGLALTYGAALYGIDKGLVEVTVGLLYLALASVRH